MSDPCPCCNGPMIIRTNRQDGRRFLGCMRFPACRGTRRLPVTIEEKNRALIRDRKIAQRAYELHKRRKKGS
jgi:ssDNA-binding Zn-finger/Zn-ribbon topoisomerase 1